MQSINYHAGITADQLVKSGFTKYWGYIVTVVTATAVINIRNGVTASGEIVEIIPTAKAVGQYQLNAPIALDDGLFVDYAASATGTLTLLFE